ncbi:MAG: hypothetical protein HY328_00990 [Chloroflexi bacterium]|nr:hypothetical protein [Chloroflexota bacterium]
MMPICRTWILEQAAADRLPFLPDMVGRHWSNDVEIDVVGKCLVTARNHTDHGTLRVIDRWMKGE